MTIVDDLILLEKNGFAILPYKMAKSEREAVIAAKKIGYPVAMKVVSSDIVHKSDVGGVKINIKTEQSLRLVYKEIMKNSHGHVVDGIIVQRMARKGVELIIGGKKDPQFGHMMVLGLGGIYVEIFRDISARICPLLPKDVDEMIAELKVHPLLEGARGKRPINKKALQKLVLQACTFMKNEDIKEMDLNPVVFDENGCDIVDARFSK